MNRDKIAITVTAVLFTLALVLPIARAVWQWLTRRGSAAAVAVEEEDDYFYEASPDGVRAGALARERE